MDLTFKCGLKTMEKTMVVKAISELKPALDNISGTWDNGRHRTIACTEKYQRLYFVYWKYIFCKVVCA